MCGTMIVADIMSASQALAHALGCSLSCLSTVMVK